MFATIDIRELPTRWDEALKLAAEGHEVVLTDGSTARARLVPFTAEARIPGLHPGAIIPAADFDAPLPDEFWTGNAS